MIGWGWEWTVKNMKTPSSLPQLLTFEIGERGKWKVVNEAEIEAEAYIEGPVVT